MHPYKGALALLEQCDITPAKPKTARPFILTRSVHVIHMTYMARVISRYIIHRRRVARIALLFCSAAGRRDSNGMLILYPIRVVAKQQRAKGI
jgi:hypothetical protein